MTNRTTDNVTASDLLELATAYAESELRPAMERCKTAADKLTRSCASETCSNSTSMSAAATVTYKGKDLVFARRCEISLKCTDVARTHNIKHLKCTDVAHTHSISHLKPAPVDNNTIEDTRHDEQGRPYPQPGDPD